MRVMPLMLTFIKPSSVTPPDMLSPSPSLRSAALGLWDQGYTPRRIRAWRMRILRCAQNDRGDREDNRQAWVVLHIDYTAGCG